jgi:hypothetical protein
MHLSFSPETLFMLPLAAIIDLVGIALLCVGLDDCGVTDVIGTTLIGGWLVLRKGVNIKITKRDKKRILKFGGSLLGEIIPYLGALPFWTILVLGTLKESSLPEEDNEN